MLIIHKHYETFSFTKIRFSSQKSKVDDQKSGFFKRN